MNKWKLKYWSETGSSLEIWFDKLTKEQFTNVAKELKLLECCGNQLRLPHSRALGGKLFELRERRFGYRIYYTFQGDHIIVLLHGGDKSSQKIDIKIAKVRLSILARSALEDITYG